MSMAKVRHVLTVAMLAAGTAAGQIPWLVREPVTAGGRQAQAFLWLPPGRETPRGLVVTVRNFAEDSFCADPVIRQSLERDRFALVLIDPNVFGGHDPPEPAMAGLIETLEVLEHASAVPGLARVPLIPFGHSAAGPWARNLTWHHPERVAAMIHFKSGQFIPPPWGDPGAKHVPVLALNGQYEEFGPHGDHGPEDTWEEQWRAMREQALVLRAGGQRIAFAIEPGGGHYCWSGRQAALVAAFFDAIAAAIDRSVRAPDGNRTFPDAWWVEADAPPGQQPRTGPVRDGSLPAAPAWWLPDEAAAKALLAASAGSDKARQTIRFAGEPVVKWQRDTLDGARLLDSSRGRITVRAAASSGLAVNYSLIEGPATHEGGGVFRLRPAMFRGGAGKPQRIRIRAWSEGDQHTGYAERVAECEIRAADGRPNNLRIEVPGQVDEGTESWAVKVAAEVPGDTDIAVLAGPAEIRNGRLFLLPVPACSRLPAVEIVIAAGHAGGNGWAAAAVERRIRMIRKPAVTPDT